MNTSFENLDTVHNQAGVQNFHGPVHFGVSAESDDVKREDDDILRSLAFPEMFDRRSSVEQPRPGSCDWILNQHEYIAWRHESRGLLWIKGKPGTRNTTLMAFLYDTLRAQRDTTRGLYLDFFFSARGMELQRTPLGMLRSLLNQLFARDLHVRPRIRELYREKCLAFGQSSRVWQWQRAELERILQDSIIISAVRGNVNIFVDALDEAGEQSARELAKYFHQLNDSISTSASVKICIACRHYPVPSTIKSAEVCVEHHNMPAITAYIDKTLSLDEGYNLSPEELKAWQDLKEDLVRRASGVFQWVRLVTTWIEKSVSEGESPSEIRYRVRQVPLELQDIYEYIFLNVIDKKMHQKSLILFQWVCLAERPLSVTEMNYALVAEQMSTHSKRTVYLEGKEKTGSDKIIESRLRSWSGGLVEIVHVLEPRDAYIVQVIHQSVTEYLVRRGLALLAGSVQESQLLSPPGPIPDGQDILTWSHATLYASCLKFMMEPRANDEIVDRRLLLSSSRYKMLEYATEYILSHAEKASNIRIMELEEEVRLWRQIISLWDSAHYYDLRASQRYSTNLVHIAASTNMMAVMKWLLEDGADLNVTDERGCTALHFAAQHGHRPMVNFIAKSGANLDVKNIAGMTPLSAAASGGHFDIVVDLLNMRGSEEDSSRGLAGAIVNASENGSLPLVKLLLHTADALCSGDVLEQALIAAARAGRARVFRFLFKSFEVNANHHRLLLGTALHAACSGQKASEDQYVEIAKALLDAGADVMTRGGRYGTALCTAVANRSYRLVALLLNSNADVETWVAGHGTALMLAISYDVPPTIVTALIKAGADVNASKYGSDTALHRAVLHSDVETTTLLLQAGANISTSKQSATSLLKAALSFSPQIAQHRVVQLLLAAGVDPNDQDWGDNTALQMVCASKQSGYQDTVRSLIAAGADVNALPGEYGTALQAACSRGCLIPSMTTSDPPPRAEELAVVRLLLSAGAKVNSDPCAGHGFALYNACLRGDGAADFVRVLLAAGANPNERVPGKGTAFHALVTGASPNLVEFRSVWSILSMAGTRVCAEHNDYDRILQIACEKNIEGLVDETIDMVILAQVEPQKYGHSLLVASQNGNTNVVGKLLDMGADVGFRSGKMNTALQAASRVEQGQDLVSLLLRKGGSLDTFGGEYGSVLNAAASFGNVETVSVLLAAGADVHTWHGVIGNALIAALHALRELRENRKFRTFISLPEKEAEDDNDDDHDSEVDQVPGYSRTLNERRNYAKIVELLLAAGADPDSQYEWTEESALQLAAVNGMRETVRALLNAGADINLRCGKWGTALQAASSEGNSLIVKQLLAAGAQVDVTDDGKYPTTIQAACYALDVVQRRGPTRHVMETMRLLLRAGATLDFPGGLFGLEPDEDRSVSPRLAYDAACMLLEAGANVSATGPSRYASAMMDLASLSRSNESEQDAARAATDFNDGPFMAPLHAACYLQDYRAVVRLVQEGADVNARHEMYGTALQMAASNARNNHGSETIMRVLIEAGADVNASGSERGSALHIASRGGHVSLVRLLIHHGANVNLQAGKSGSVIQAAISEADDWLDYEVLSILIAAGADVNAAGGEFGTALQAASLAGSHAPAMVERLLDAGADVHMEGGRYGTALQAAARNTDSSETLFMLLEAGAKVNTCCGRYGNPLQAASRDGSATNVKALLNSGADPNAKGGRYNGALQAALASGKSRHQKLRILLEAGADPSAMSERYGAALHMAASLSDTVAVRLFLQAGADVNLVAGPYGSVLQAAAAEPLYRPGEATMSGAACQIVKDLIEAGADVNASGGRYGSALRAAVSTSSSEKHELIQCLLTAGADVNLGTDAEHTMLDRALFALMVGSDGCETVFQLLLDAGVDVDAQQRRTRSTSLHMALSARDGRTVRLLLRAGAHPDKTDFSGQTPLHIAAQNGMNSIVRQLCELKVDLDRCDYFGRTPLHLSTYHAHFEVASFLISYGADPTRKDGYGRCSNSWTGDRLNAESFNDIEVLTTNFRQEDDSLGTLRKSICDLSRRLLATGKKYTKPGFDELGHCLIFLEKLDDARISFEHQVLRIREDTYEADHDAACRACNRRQTDNPITGSRFVCRTCADVNLCSRCMRRYPRRAPNPACRGHTFLQIEAPLDMIPIGVIDQSGSISDATRQWLQGLIEQFGSQPHQKSDTEHDVGVNHVRQRKGQHIKVEDNDARVIEIDGPEQSERDLKIETAKAEDEETTTQSMLVLPRAEKPEKSNSANTGMRIATLLVIVCLVIMATGTIFMLCISAAWPEQTKVSLAIFLSACKKLFEETF